eukprot:scaffold10172_cov62-Cyclotella_meneghiniana.AAC.4
MRIRVTADVPMPIVFAAAIVLPSFFGECASDNRRRLDDGAPAAVDVGMYNCVFCNLNMAAGRTNAVAAIAARQMTDCIIFCFILLAMSYGSAHDRDDDVFHSRRFYPSIVRRG